MLGVLSRGTSPGYRGRRGSLRLRAILLLLGSQLDFRRGRRGLPKLEPVLKAEIIVLPVLFLRRKVIKIPLHEIFGVCFYGSDGAVQGVC